MKSWILLATTLAGASAFGAQTVNFDFGKTSSPYTDAGAAADTGTVWNATDGIGRTDENVLDSYGVETTYDITWTAAGTFQDTDGYNVGGTKSGGIYSLTNGYNLMVDYMYGSAQSITLSDLANGGMYTLYMYGYGNNSGAGTKFTVNGVELTSGTLSTVGLTNLTEDAHYVVFNNVVATNGQITIHYANPVSGNTAVNGMQLVSEDAVLPPFDVETISAVDEAVDLSWGAVAGADSYNVYRTTTSYSNYTQIATGVVGTNYADTGLTNNIEYFYAVSAVSGVVESALSPEISATPIAGNDTTPPDVPTGLVADFSKHWKVELAWDDSAAPDWSHYTVYRSASSGVTGEAIATNLTVAAYTDWDVSETGDYYYSVSATDLNDNESAASAQSNGTVPVNNHLGDIDWGLNDGYVDLNDNGLQDTVGQNNIWIFQMANAADSNVLYDVALKIVTVGSFNTKESLHGLSCGSNAHITSNETLVITLEGVYERDTTGLADSGVKVADRAIAPEAVPVDLASLTLTDWASENPDILTNTVADGTTFSWQGTQGENQGGLDYSFFRVVIGDPYAAWADTWGVELGAAGDDYDNDGVLNLAEYALNGNPTNGVDDTETELLTDTGLVYVHAQRNDDAALVYTVITTDMLSPAAWADEGYTTPVGTNVTGGVYDYVTNAVPTSDSAKFIKVQVSK